MGPSIKRALFPSYRRLVSRLHELNYLFLEVTQKCNLSCLHCGSDCRKDVSVPDLSQEAILRVLREIRGRQRPHGVTVVLTGGEPLCYPDLFELGAEIRRLEFPWSLVTNGYAWTEDRVRRAEQAGLNSITVSLDGLAAEHDWLRGQKHSFKRALRAIELFTREQFWQAMDVVTCVNRRNLGQLETVYDLLQDRGVPSWRLFTISPIGRAAKLPELLLSPEGYRDLLETIVELRRRGKMAVELSESGYLGRRYELCARDALFFCRAGITIAGIMVNGDILACPNIDRRFAQGNIHHDSFVEVWEKKYAQFRDRSWMRTGLCASCSEWRFCQGNSFHLWDLDQGRPRICHCRDFGLIGEG